MPLLRNALLALLLAAAGWCAQAQMPAASAVPAAPTGEQVHEAVERVRADPLLGHAETRKVWRLKQRDEKKASKDSTGSPIWDWLAAFATWFARTLRVMMWVLGALVVALVLVGLRRWVRARDASLPRAGVALPSHVQNLDIRPESLPEAVGAAAAALWQRGQQRAALSLLYRGALSRLVHRHALPIGAASTEGECLALASQRLDAPRAAFFARLVGVWLHAVYGARMPDAAQALGLCREFDLQLAAAPAGGGAA